MGRLLQKAMGTQGIEMLYRRRGAGCGEAVCPLPTEDGSGRGCLSPENFGICVSKWHVLMHHGAVSPNCFRRALAKTDFCVCMDNLLEFDSRQRTSCILHRAKLPAYSGNGIFEILQEGDQLKVCSRRITAPQRNAPHW